MIIQPKVQHLGESDVCFFKLLFSLKSIIPVEKLSGGGCAAICPFSTK